MRVRILPGAPMSTNKKIGLVIGLLLLIGFAAGFANEYPKYPD